MILCDTDIMIEFYKNNPAIVATLRNIGQNHMAVSVISQAELYFGALNKPELHRIRRHLAQIRRYPVDAAISERFIALMETYALSHGPAIPDALIAATALTHSIELFTLNIRDFRFIADLRLHTPETHQ